MRGPTHSDILAIASELREFFVYQEKRDAEFSIFLCGGARNSTSSIRKSVREKIESKKSNYVYRVHYPEDMFVELLLGHQKDSLLDLENLLADSVSSVAIITESPGALVELGAFSNHDKLCRKLIVFLDEKYKTHKSFINMGPVRRLKRSLTSRVYYSKLDGSASQQIADLTCESTREIAAACPISRELTNPIAAHRFYLALIYVFDPISIENVLRISNDLLNGAGNVDDIAGLVVTTLISDGMVVTSHGDLSTTPAAKDFLIDQNQTKKKASETASFLTKMRTQALNAVLRKNIL